MYIALDIGGTKTNIGFFKTLKSDSLIKEITIPTNENFKQGISEIFNEIEKYKKGKITGIGISIAALVEDGFTKGATNFPDWGNRNIEKIFKDKYSCLVKIQHDGTCAGLAELIYGEGKDKEVFIKLVLGTGLGGVYVDRSNKNLIIKNIEPGGMIVEKGGQRHKVCKGLGLLESYVGGMNIEFNKHIKLSEISDNHAIWKEVGEYLTVGIYNLAVLFQPEVIFLGGGMIFKRPFLKDYVVKHLTNEDEYMARVPEIKISKLGANAQLLGALALLNKKI